MGEKPLNFPSACPLQNPKKIKRWNRWNWGIDQVEIQSWLITSSFTKYLDQRWIWSTILGGREGGESKNIWTVWIWLEPRVEKEINIMPANTFFFSKNIQPTISFFKMIKCTFKFALFHRTTRIIYLPPKWLPYWICVLSLEFCLKKHFYAHILNITNAYICTMAYSYLTLESYVFPGALLTTGRMRHFHFA